MNIEVLLTEAEIAEEFAESLEARDLPEKFFYWSATSVQAWKMLAAESQSSLLDTWKDLARLAPELTKAFGTKVPVISFGSGDGTKDRLVLQALQRAGREVSYFPVDSSQTMLEMACAAAEDDDCEATGIKADISSPMHMLLAADAAEAPRLFIMAGNTIGRFDPLDQIKHIANSMHKGDILIVDAEIDTDPGGPPAPTEEQRRFAFAPLATAGIVPNDGELKFERRKDERRDGMTISTRRFQANRDLELNVAGHEIHIERGERIFLNFRYLLTTEAFKWLLTDHAELKVVGEMPSPDGKFLTAVCIK